jgi:peptidoglycan/xylan/chitin deacetylase (PgdA/CDA1 family)
MKSNLKNFVKNWAYQSGLLGAYHRIRNRKRLTVVMFHRVLPAWDPRYRGADPEWTMTPDAFAGCLDFFKRHYNVATPDQVFSALRGETKLPDRSLLITFDDGWADTAEYALPILEKFSMLSLVFVVGSAIDQAEPFWEESLYSFLVTQPQGFSKLQDTLEQNGIKIPAVASSERNEKSIKAVIRRLGQVDMPVLKAIVSSLKQVGQTHAAMLDTEQLAQLVKSGHAIGGHGMTHRPLTKVKNISEELKNAREIMSTYLNNSQVDAMSFPHGAYSDTVITHCRSTGYQYLFSSDAHLNIFTKKGHAIGPVGRIHLSERALINSAGQFQPVLLAFWLFLRPSRQLN